MCLSTACTRKHLKRKIGVDDAVSISVTFIYVEGADYEAGEGHCLKGRGGGHGHLKNGH